MVTLRKTLGVLCLLIALATLVMYYFDAVEPVTAVPVWYVLATLVSVALLLTVVVNVADSLRGGREPAARLRQLPRDAVTAVGAVVFMVYLHNHLLFVVEPGSENIALWQYLDPVAIAVLTWEGIGLARSRVQQN